MYPSISGIGQAPAGQVPSAAPSYPSLPQQQVTPAAPGTYPFNVQQQSQHGHMGYPYPSQLAAAEQSCGLPGASMQALSAPSATPIQQQHALYPLNLAGQQHQPQLAHYPGLQQQAVQQHGYPGFPAHQQQQQQPYPASQQQQPSSVYPNLPYSVDKAPAGSYNSTTSSSLYAHGSSPYSSLNGSMGSSYAANANSFNGSSTPTATEAAVAAAPYMQQQQQQQQPPTYPHPIVQHPQQQQQQQPAYPQLPQQQQQQQPAYPQLSQQQQQQQQQQLPGYPAVPQPLPFTAPPDKVRCGYDVMVYILQAKNLPGMDWWNGLADPYVIITIMTPGGEQISYKTKTVYKDLNPKFDEFFEVGNLPAGTSVMVEVWDKDVVTEDDIMGRACWAFAPKELLPSSAAGGGMLGGDASWGRLLVPLKLSHPRNRKDMGTVEIEVCYRPSIKPGKPALMGPVKFKQTLSPTAGLFTGHFWGAEDTMCFSTYKLYLMHIESTFGSVRMPWNRKYDKAVQIFNNPVALTVVKTQHSSLYASSIGMSRCGVLTCAADFFDLFKCGVRAGQRRYFTYCLLKDSLRCSETGAAFFNDMMSKHAMHAAGEEEVLYAGEFCIVPDASAAAGHRLVIDNNSGTYAPDSKQLHLMAKLFKANFPDIEVEVLAVGDPRLRQYQQQCPSRATA